MKTVINKILMKIAQSVDSTKVSTARLQSYLMMFPILAMVFVFLVIEIWAFAHTINAGKDYRLSNEIILVFGMMLAHHLSILFSRSKNPSIGDITQDIGSLKTTSTEKTSTETVTTENTTDETVSTENN